MQTRLYERHFFTSEIMTVNIFTKQVTVLIVMIFLFGSSVPAQVKFEAIPKELATKYKFDFAKNFFSSAEVQKADLKKSICLARRIRNF